MRLIGAEGEQIGIVDIQFAIQKAREANLDLLEIVPNAEPPVCKIIDFGKYRYEIQKREKEARKKHTHTGEVKEIRMRPVTDDHDYTFKMKHAINFLKEGFKVKLVIVYKGREIANRDAGTALAAKMVEDLLPYGKLDADMKFEGRNMVMIFIKNTAK